MPGEQGGGCAHTPRRGVWTTVFLAAPQAPALPWAMRSLSKPPSWWAVLSLGSPRKLTQDVGPTAGQATTASTVAPSGTGAWPGCGRSTQEGGPLRSQP